MDEEKETEKEGEEETEHSSSEQEQEEEEEVKDFKIEEGVASSDEAKEEKVESSGEVKDSSAVEEEPENRRSPRVKTTPLRRSSEVKSKPTLSGGDSESTTDPDDSPATEPVHGAADEGLGRVTEDSDSDEVPTALLQRAAMTHSSDDADNEDKEEGYSRVTKKCLFGLTRNKALSPEQTARRRKTH